MSPDPERIVWCARYFQRHAAVWSTVAGQMSSAAETLKQAPPHDEQTWAWPDLKSIHEEFVKAHTFLTDDFVAKAPEEMNALSSKLIETMKTYIAAEAENNAEIVQQVNKELGI
ncbi:MAG: hypothetical protein Q4G45_06125 [Actinomycetia bacterium]|nr:hypothetical protein [Actinomycetes bacterium]